MSNGEQPKYNSNASIPIAHKSTFSSYRFPCNISGDKYKGVPQKVFLKSPGCNLLAAHPKSQILTLP